MTKSRRLVEISWSSYDAEANGEVDREVSECHRVLAWVALVVVLEQKYY